MAELSWVTPTGRPDALPATPLLLGEQPALAYPYAYAGLAREIAAAPAIALTVSEPRMTGSGWRALAATGRATLVEDPEGELFRERLLREELRKYPPSRALADSLILQRENWWYLPRLIVLLDLRPSTPVEPRTEGGHQVLTMWDGDLLYVDTVSVVQVGSDRLKLASLSGRPAVDGPAALLGHDFSVPDLERWTPWVTRGMVTGDLLSIIDRPTRTILEPNLSLRQRYRRQRDLEKACRANLP
ncbi:MAG TPA: pyridoxamine 5'-phosphate oxidase family protein [Jiangellales bacterium]|nr:pyridoxamine 5'-phosphate oxidase family protein [Jiangellales bacterium]